MPSHFAPLSSLSFNVISAISGKAYSFKQSNPSLVTNQKDVEWLRTQDALYECKADGTPVDPRRGPRATRRPQAMTSVALVPSKPKPLSVAKFVADVEPEVVSEEAKVALEEPLPKPAVKKKKAAAKKAPGKKRGRPKKKK